MTHELDSARRNAHDVIELTQAGMKSAEIARRLKLSRQRVSQIQRAHGIQVRAGLLTPTRPVYDGVGAPLTVTTPETRAQMVAMYREGWTRKSLAKHFGCSYSLVWLIVHTAESEATS